MQEQQNIKSSNNCIPILTKCTECGLKFNFVNKHIDKTIYCQCVIPWLLSKNLEENYMEHSVYHTSNLIQRESSRDITHTMTIELVKDSEKNEISCKHIVKKQKKNVNTENKKKEFSSKENNYDYFSKFKIIKILYQQKNYQISEDELKKMFITI